MSEENKTSADNSHVAFSDTDSLLERYKNDQSLSEEEAITIASRLQSLFDVIREVHLPENVSCVCLVGSYSNNDKTRKPRTSGKDQSDIDILVINKTFRGGKKTYEQVKSQVIAKAKELGKDDLVPLLEFNYINPIELLLPGRYAYKHMLKTATFLAGDIKLFQSKYGKYRDVGLTRPDEDISFENWADMH